MSHKTKYTCDHCKRSSYDANEVVTVSLTMQVNHTARLKVVRNNYESGKQEKDLCFQCLDALGLLDKHPDKTPNISIEERLWDLMFDMAKEALEEAAQ